MSHQRGFCAAVLLLLLLLVQLVSATNANLEPVANVDGDAQFAIHCAPDIQQFCATRPDAPWQCLQDHRHELNNNMCKIYATQLHECAESVAACMSGSRYHLAKYMDTLQRCLSEAPAESISSGCQSLGLYRSVEDTGRMRKSSADL